MDVLLVSNLDPSEYRMTVVVVNSVPPFLTLIMEWKQDSEESICLFVCVCTEGIYNQLSEVQIPLDGRRGERWMTTAEVCKKCGCSTWH